MNKQLTVITVCVVVFFIVASIVVVLYAKQNSIQQVISESEQQIAADLEQIEDFEDLNVTEITEEVSITQMETNSVAEIQKAEEEIDTTIKEMDVLLGKLNADSDFADFGSLD